MDNKEKTFYEEIDRSGISNELYRLFREGASSYTDGFTSCHYKHQLFLFKCLIDELYNGMPSFPDQEREWEEERSKHQMWKALKNGK